MEEEEKAGFGVQQEILNNQAMLSMNREDGNLIISFSENDIEARADFTPPIGKGRPLDIEDIRGFLQRINIIYGVRWNEIEQAIVDCNLNHQHIINMVIACGDYPANEVAEYYEMSPLLVKAGRSAGNLEQIDYHAYSPFVIVKKNQIMAKLHERKPGKEGTNIHGASLPFTLIKPEGVTGGENTRTENGFIYSNIHGQLIENKKELSVQGALHIKGSVGYSTGNIVFPGDVLIEGNVQDGFKIYSGGTLSIKQTFDVTNASIKGDVFVAGGIVGRGAAIVKSGGGVRTKFIENCRIAARKNISVDADIINSRVFTLERIEMGEKGLILGSEVYALRGIKAAGIGKKFGQSSRVHCGIDFALEQEKNKNNNLLKLIAIKIAKLKDFLEQSNISAKERERDEKIMAQLREEQQKAAARVSELLGNNNNDENAVIEVTGEIRPGTLIEICQAALFVSETLHKVRIRFDKTMSKLITEPLA